MMNNNNQKNDAKVVRVSFDVVTSSPCRVRQLMASRQDGS